MTLANPLEYECMQCGNRELTEDALLSICRRCGGEMRNVDIVRDTETHE